jgi:hypothetical protein
MKHFLRFLQVIALGSWMGSIIFFSFAVAPGVFGILASRDEAGAVVGFALGRLHLMGLIAAIVYVVAALGFAGSLKALSKPPALAVLAMFFLTFASQRIVIPRMEALRVQMGSVAATPTGSPLRVEFDRLHGVSVKMEGAVLLIGLVAMFLTVRNSEEKN